MAGDKSLSHRPSNAGSQSSTVTDVSQDDTNTTINENVKKEGDNISFHSICKN